MRENYSDILAFIAVAREKSFTRAAAKLGVSQSALSHSMRALESRLGIRLLTRTTRNVSTTEAGERILNRIAPRFEDIDTELECLSELRDKPAGLVRINCSDHAAKTIIWPKLAPMLDKFPDIRLEVSMDNGFTNIVSGRFDAGVRLGEAVEKDMIAVKIGPEWRMAVVATPEYLDKFGRPETPEDLLKHKCIGMRMISAGGVYEWELDNGDREITVKPRGQVIFNNPYLIHQAALDGFGLAFLPEDIFLADFESGKLEQVLTDWCLPFPGYHLYYPNRNNHSPAFSTVVDALRHYS
ncbi:LysR family transcriptional regulator [Alteromonas confluentis]|uniref:LysR family transcriptional regulator n=1 Tax=Alteromonas confluentis TaxID=1656094 RepID=A0A1E7ZFC4_9ALTE|nr:LysR family transcriptional regulator [Alteromonas confluentis]OFC72211.1 LysR family transcriptional regulator [Alteromonas confluentis]